MKYLAKLGASRIIARQGSTIEFLADEIKKLGADVAIIPGNASDRPIADQLKEASVGVPLKGIILGDSGTFVSDVTFTTDNTKLTQGIIIGCGSPSSYSLSVVHCH